VETSDGVRFGGDMDSFENTYGSLGHEISIFEPMAITSTDVVAGIRSLAKVAYDEES
jgi:hypothetical protein